MTKNKGFTLIELMVVIAIISLLSSVVLASIVSARDKAKIVKFKQDFAQLDVAVSLYKASNNAWPSSMSNYVSLNNLASELFTAGVYSKNSFDIPQGLEGYEIYPGGFFGEITCGNPTDSNEYAFYFGFNDSSYIDKFPILYYQQSSYANIYGCLNFN